MFGPLAVAAVLAHRGDHHLAFAMLLLPALICRKRGLEPGTERKRPDLLSFLFGNIQKIYKYILGYFNGRV
jgi:hypothetical protein